MATTCVSLLFLVLFATFEQLMVAERPTKECPDPDQEICRIDYDIVADSDPRYAKYDVCLRFSATKHKRWSCKFVREDDDVNFMFQSFSPNKRRAICRCQRADKTLYIVEAHGFYVTNDAMQWKYDMPVVLFNEPGQCLMDDVARKVRKFLENGTPERATEAAAIFRTVKRKQFFKKYVFAGDSGFQDTSGVYQINIFKRAGREPRVEQQLLYDVVKHKNELQYFQLSDLAAEIAKQGGDASTPIYWLCCSVARDHRSWQFSDIRENVPQSPVITAAAVLKRRKEKAAQCQREATALYEVVNEMKATLNALNGKNIKFRDEGKRNKLIIGANRAQVIGLIAKEVPVCDRDHNYAKTQRKLSHPASDNDEWCWFGKFMNGLKTCLDNKVYTPLDSKYHVVMNAARNSERNMYAYETDEYDEDEGTMHDMEEYAMFGEEDVREMSGITVYFLTMTLVCICVGLLCGVVCGLMGSFCVRKVTLLD